MKKVLVIFAHPAFERSRTHKRLLQSIQGLDGIEFHDLYESYPKKIIDIQAEKRRLAEHDTLVLQYPLHWYQPPSLLKEWMDLVLQFGWAYGPGGDKLSGKSMHLAISAGGSEAAYSGQGMHADPLGVFLRPMEQSAHICSMTFGLPFIVHDAVHVSEDALELAAEDYRDYLYALVHANPVPQRRTITKQAEA